MPFWSFIWNQSEQVYRSIDTASQDRCQEYVSSWTGNIRNWYTDVWVSIHLSNIQWVRGASFSSIFNNIERCTIFTVEHMCCAAAVLQALVYERNGSICQHPRGHNTPKHMYVGSVWNKAGPRVKYPWKLPRTRNLYRLRVHVTRKN